MIMPWKQPAIVQKGDLICMNCSDLKKGSYLDKRIMREMAVESDLMVVDVSVSDIGTDL